MDFPVSEPVTLRDQLDVTMLVGYLRRETRDRPVVVLTVPFGQHQPSIDPHEIAIQGVDVVTIPNPDLTWYFAELVAAEAAVFNGACRVYPPGQEWESFPSTAPVRMARNSHEIDALPSLLSADVKRALAKKTTAAAPIPWATHGPHPVPTPGPHHGVPAVPSDPSSGVPEAIATSADAQVLAAYLRNPARRLPAVVVSRAAGTNEAFVDVREAREQLSGFAQVFEITTLKASWALRAALPPHCDVYGGASRVYPIGTAWLTDPTLSPLRFAHSLRERGTITRTLISDAMKMASHGSYSTAAAAQKRTRVTGSVLGVVAERGLVALSSGERAVLWPELVEPSLSADRLFAAGMEVHGELDPETRCIDVSAMKRDAVEALDAYHVGDTILVRVASVSAESCVVELFPGQTATVSAQDVTETEVPDLSVLVSKDEVLPVYIVYYDASVKEWLLSLSNAADAEDAVAAPSVLMGGPPWLVPTPAPQAAEEEVAGSVVFDEGLFETADAASVARSLHLENQQLAEQLRQAQDDVALLQDQLMKAKKQSLAGIRSRSRQDREARANDRRASDLNLFLDEREQLEFEIRLAWARMTLPAEKALYPLKPWSYSDQFFDTLRTMQGVSRDKIVEVIVYVLTGRDSELASRERHQLRTGPGGDDPPRTRKGGSEICYRVSLQQKSASARRLHYWICQDGSIELASVRLHDDFNT